MVKTSMPTSIKVVLALFSILILISLSFGDLVHATVSVCILAATYFAYTKNVLRAQDIWLFPLMAALYMGGSILGFYEKYYNYDKPVHLVSAFVVSYFLGRCIERFVIQRKIHPLVFFLLTVSAGFAVGAGWEIFEWMMQFIVPHELIRGVDDTITDLITDLVGAVLAALVLLKKER